MGIGYVIEHYIAYFHKWQDERMYKAYVTDCLRIMTENTAKSSGGSYIKVRYADLIEPAEEEERTAEEIINNIKDKLEKLNNE